MAARAFEHEASLWDMAGIITGARFRHHFSHTWLDRGGPEGDLMELNGWTSPQMLRRYGASASSTGDPAVLRMYHGATVALCHHEVEPQPGAPTANVLAHYLNGTDKPTYYQLSIGLSTR